MKGKTLSNLLLLGWCVILMIACSGEKPHYVIGVSQCSEDIWRSWQNAEMVMESNFHDGVELRWSCALLQHLMIPSDRSSRLIVWWIAVFSY